MIRHRAELKTLRDGGQQQRRFQQCERFADALPGAAAEWEVCKARQLLRSFRQPAIGVEFLRIGKIFRIAMHDPRAHHDISAGWNAVSSKVKVLHYSSSEAPSRRIKT